MYLQEGNVNLAQVIIVTLWGVTDEKFALRVVVFQPVFEGSTHEAASDNSNVNHIIESLLLIIAFVALNHATHPAGPAAVWNTAEAYLLAAFIFSCYDVLGFA
jgi:hypothetical protein